VFAFLLILASLSSTDPWLASRDASLSAWLSDLAAGMHPEATGQMDLFEAGSPFTGAPPPLGEDSAQANGVMRRRRLSLAIQGNVEDTASRLRLGAAVLWERGGWNRELSWTGRPDDLAGASWAGGLLLAWRPSLQVGMGVLRRQELTCPAGELGDVRDDAWGLLRLGRLSWVGQGGQQGLAMSELAWQVDPAYSPEKEGMVWRELSLGVRYVDAGHNAWDESREGQGYLVLPLWLDQLRLLVQGGTAGSFERATIQSDLLPQGLVGVDLSYARTRWTGRSWGLRLRFTALTLGWNDPEDLRDYGPTGQQPVFSLRLRMTFDSPQIYYSPTRHVGPLEKIRESSRAL
jgi:hypothetical protein